MATGRTTIRYTKIYVDGYDLSGYSRSFGPCTVMMEEADASTVGDSSKTYIPDQASVTINTINAVLDTTAGASHDVLQSPTYRTVMIPFGIQTAPVQGDYAFVGQFDQSEAATTVETGSVLTVNAPFSGWSAQSTTTRYANPWARLLHAKGAETAVNTAVGIDDLGAASTAGGYMCYQLFTSNGTVNLKVQDASTNTNPSFSDLAASGLVDATTTPKHGLVALSKSATVQRYLRWQLTFGTATTATFAIAFVRG